MIDNTAITFTTQGFFAVSGSRGSEKRRNPYVPIFSRTLARITEPAVGASTCAKGSQVWNGHIGTFTAKEAKKASHSSNAISLGNLLPIIAVISVVPIWITIQKIATSIRTEPRKV